LESAETKWLLSPDTRRRPTYSRVAGRSRPGRTAGPSGQPFDLRSRSGRDARLVRSERAASRPAPDDACRLVDSVGSGTPSLQRSGPWPKPGDAECDGRDPVDRWRGKSSGVCGGAPSRTVTIGGVARGPGEDLVQDPGRLRPPGLAGTEGAWYSRAGLVTQMTSAGDAGRHRAARRLRAPRGTTAPHGGDGNPRGWACGAGQ